MEVASEEEVDGNEESEEGGEKHRMTAMNMNHLYPIKQCTGMVPKRWK